MHFICIVFSPNRPISSVSIPLSLPQQLSQNSNSRAPQWPAKTPESADSGSNSEVRITKASLSGSSETNQQWPKFRYPKPFISILSIIREATGMEKVLTQRHKYNFPIYIEVRSYTGPSTDNISQIRMEEEVTRWLAASAFEETRLDSLLALLAYCVIQLCKKSYPQANRWPKPCWTMYFQSCINFPLRRSCSQSSGTAETKIWSKMSYRDTTARVLSSWSLAHSDV